VLQSDDLDEIDWEWVGGSPNKVQTNYFSKGDTTTYDRGATHDVPESTSQFHTYTVEWTRECIKWEINGVEVRRLNFADAKGGTTYPQTPMQVKLGSWVAGRKDAPKGTVEWSGGYANFDNGPVDAFYRKVVVTDYMGGGGETGVKSYVYGDKTGTWESIILDKEGGGLENKGKDDSSESDDEKTGSSTATVGSKNGTTGGSKTAGDGSLPSNTGASEVQVPGAAPKASLALAGLLLSGSAILLNLFV
jgi:beta-glucanase (GH16 family)